MNDGFRNGPHAFKALGSRAAAQLARPLARPRAGLRFDVRELAGSMGDLGTLFPLVVGYIAVNGMDPAGLFILLGLTNVAMGLIYGLPMPVQPKKVIAVAAIAQKWPPSLIYASGFGLGLTWFLFVFSGLLRRIVAVTPLFVVRGIQLALGLTLALKGFKMMQPMPLLGALAVVIALVLHGNRYAPAAIVLVALGVGIAAWQGKLAGAFELAVTLPRFAWPRLAEVWQAMFLAGFAQIPLSITNAVIATAACIRDYFPERAVSERRLMLNMGAVNVVGSLLGGMPVCHGVGGLVGKVYFGARTGGASVLEGAIELSLGLFLSKSIVNVLAAFPMPLVGGMMFLVGIQLGKGVARLRGWKVWLSLLTAAVALLTNMAAGFVVGVAAAFVMRWLKRRGVLSCVCRTEEEE